MAQSILLVEPDELLAKLYAAALQQDGHTVIWRKTAGASVVALDESGVDLILLELNMALHNGLEFLYEIRSYTDLQGLKVILHTNVREAQLAPSVLRQLGISEYLYKPTTSLAKLRETVNSVARAQA